MAQHLPPEGVAEGVSLLRHFEKTVLHPYYDSVAKIWSIGDGETTLLDGSPVTEHTPPLSEAQSLALTRRKIDRDFVPAISSGITRDLSPNQAAALLSLVWNVGTGTFERSYLRQYINDGNFLGAGSAFRSYCYSRGKFVPALLHRRMAEMAVWDGVHPTVQAVLIQHAVMSINDSADELNAKELASLTTEN